MSTRAVHAATLLLVVCMYTGNIC